MGLLDLDGRVVLFDHPVQHCADGRLVADKNKEWFYYQGDESPLQPPDGRLLRADCGSTPPFILKIGDKLALVDARSTPLTPVQFDAVEPVATQVWNVKRDGKWGRIGPDRSWLIEPKFDYLSRDLDVVVAAIDDKRGFMRSDGSWLIEPTFDAAARRRDKETAFVTRSGTTGTLRLADQSWIVPPHPGVSIPCTEANPVPSFNGRFECNVEH